MLTTNAFAANTLFLGVSMLGLFFGIGIIAGLYQGFQSN